MLKLFGDVWKIFKIIRKILEMIEIRSYEKRYE